LGIFVQNPISPGVSGRKLILYPAGNEARHVTIVDNSGIVATPNVTYNYTTLPDINIAFIGT